jgi:hypothetical protein
MKPRTDSLFAALHIATICGFAFAQPLYDLLGRDAAFFVAHRSQPGDIVMLVIGLSLCLPVSVFITTSLFSPRCLRTGVQVCLVGLLSSLVAVQGFNRLTGLSGKYIPAASVLGGSAFAFAYSRFRPMRTFLLVLSPAILIFPGLFLCSPQVSRILQGDPDDEIICPAIEATTPVVVVVFDEFPLASLLDERHEIDAVRFPHFAALAREATWFRNATTVHYTTTCAVPAILTGKYPAPCSEDAALPTVAEHPHNLFTLLGGSYDLRVFESVTRLCPRRLAGETADSNDARRLSLLLNDLALVELHLLAPRDWRRRLPSITQGWSDFGGACACCPPGVRTDDRPGLFAQFLDSLVPSTRPTLHFLHIVLPHSPFRFMPDGKRYATDTGVDALSAEGVWPNEEEPVIQAQQRHLLQVCYVDRLLGQLLSRLKSAGLYENALLVVTADHGISFIPRQPYRHATPATYPDILRVPLFVKKPGQHEGTLSNRNVQAIDILPTIADVLGVRMPWVVDGQSAFDTARPEPAEKVFIDQGQRLVYDRALTENYGQLKPRLSLFGSGSEERLFRISEDTELVGLPVDKQRVLGTSRVSVELEDADAWTHVMPEQDYVPANLRGVVHLPDATSNPVSLAVAINGTIQAVSRSYGREGDLARWSAIVPAAAFRDGRNSVALYVVIRDGDGRTWLQRVLMPSSDRRRDGDGSLLGGDGQPLHIIPRCLAGCVDQVRMTDGCLEVAGWAVDVKNRELPAAILVFANGKLLHAGPPNTARADVAKSTGLEGLERSGFTFSLPLVWFQGRDDAEVRLFAVSRRGPACELSYPRWYQELGRRPLTARP